MDEQNCIKEAAETLHRLQATKGCYSAKQRATAIHLLLSRCVRVLMLLQYILVWPHEHAFVCICVRVLFSLNGTSALNWPLNALLSVSGFCELQV